MNRSKILIISKVLPFPRNSGQQMRIYNMIKALSKNFHITFFTSVDKNQADDTKIKLKKYVDTCIVLNTEYSGLLKKIYLNVAGFVWALKTGLKMSNYIVGEYDFTIKKIEKEIQNQKFDAVLFEYWHAHKTIKIFRQKNIPTILDMHNILWRSYESQVKRKKWIPKFIKKWSVKRYRQFEQMIWKKFDGIISINDKESEYVKNILRNRCIIECIPMGIDFNKWTFKREITTPQRVGYYGGLGSIHNQGSAKFCYQKIMPLIWNELSDIELWLIGSNPPKDIRNLELIDNRVKVTGYLKNTQDTLKTMSVVICPWNGTYGFRSRIIEIMALGIPIITTSDAISGMDLKDSEGIYIAQDSNDYSKTCLTLLQNKNKNISDGIVNTKYAKKLYSFDKTYVKAPIFINTLIDKRKRA